MTLAGDPDALAVVDPGRNLHLEAALDEHAPLARQSRHGVSSTLPAPPHSGQLRCWTNWPKTFRETLRTIPDARRTSSTRAAPVPGSAPVAPQRSHGRATSTGTVAGDARERLLEVDLDDGLEVGPARGRRRSLRSAAEEVLAEERREDVGEVPEVGERRLEAAAPEPGVPEAVVRRAALRVGEDLVRLGDLAEALVGVRGRRDIRVELARERAERTLDLRADAPRCTPSTS